MFLRTLAEQQDIIEVYKATFQVPQDAVHQPLERLSSVAHAHTETAKVKHTPRRVDTCFWTISLINIDQMKRLLEVNLAEDCAARDVLNIIPDMRERVMIKDGPFIELSVISNNSKSSRGLGDKMYW